MQRNMGFQVHARGWHWQIASLAALLALRGLAASVPAHAGEPKQPQAKLNAANPNFIVIPIKTELQRKFLHGDKSLKAYVELNGSAFLGNDLTQAIDPPALSRALAAVKGSDQESKVVFNTYFQKVEGADAIIKPLEKALDGIAREAGFPKASNRFTYAGKFDWNARVASANAIDFEADVADESGVGDPLVMAYPVRTKASHLITSVDCVVFFRRPLNPADEPVITEATKDRLRASISDLDLQAKKNILFITLLMQAGYDFETRSALQDRLVDGNKSGELQELGSSLDFADTAVKFE